MKDLKNNKKNYNNELFINDLLNNLSIKLRTIYRYWLADCIINNTYLETIDEFKTLCKQISYEYLFHVIDDFDETQYFKNIVQYIDILIDNLIINKKES